MVKLSFVVYTYGDFEQLLTWLGFDNKVVCTGKLMGNECELLAA